MNKRLIWLLITLICIAAVIYFWEPILDSLPIDQSGWDVRHGQRYYLDEKGDPKTGWLELEKGTFYLGSDGVMHTGWLEENGNRYFLDNSGRLTTGWQTIQDKTYFFGPEGTLCHGFVNQEGQRFYLDENGSPVSGFYSDGDTTYYLLDNGTILSGWFQFSGNTYYLREDGSVYTGWLEEDGKRYFFSNADGSMATGITEIDGSLYGFDEMGVSLAGWAELNGQRYYLNQDGTLYQGWLEEDGKRYYIREDGTPAVGKLVIDEEAYFFSSSGVNFIMVNPWHYLPKDFEVELVNACGALLDPVCQEDLERMLSDCRAAGHNPRIISSYRSIAAQRANLQNKIDAMGGNYAAATKIIAVPGTSEHHLGLAFDIVDSAFPELSHRQAQRPTQQWLMEHCWEYGFILRYPDNSIDITGIIWEPWHYRYVGVEIAMEIRDMGKITLEEYIDNLTNDGTTCGGKKPAE